MKKESKQIEGSLNLLKCIASIVIILHHFQQITRIHFEGMINFWGGNFYCGYMVELFFLLSGYFMYSYSQKATACEEGFFAFFWRKYRRFLPLLIITGAAAAIVLKWVTAVKGISYDYDIWIVLAGMLGIGQWFSNAAVTNNPTWYISVLLVCLAIFYFTTYVAKTIKINNSAIYLGTMWYGIIMYHICNTYKFNMPLFSVNISRGVICFFAGLLLNAFLNRVRIHEKAIFIMLCILYLIAFCSLYNVTGGAEMNMLYYLLCFTVFPCIIVLFKTKVMVTICSFSLFTLLANISYHTYMWHLTVIRFIYNFLNFQSIKVDAITMGIICLFLSILTGTISYVIGLKIKRTIINE